MRKRTKTGCLTCRKRRIKCGEERPTCANCIKSKRQCEGYNQRVVFKPPIGDWPNHPGVVSTLQYHSSMLPGSRNTYPGGGQTSTQSQDPALTSLQPRAVTQFDFSNIETGPVPGLEQINNQQVLVGGPQPYPQDANYQQPLRSPHPQPPLQSPHHPPLHTPTSAAPYFGSEPSPVNPSFSTPYSHESNAAYQSQQRYPQGGHYQQAPVSYDSHRPSVSEASHEQALYQQPQRSPAISEEQSSYLLHSTAPAGAENYSHYIDQRQGLPRYGNNTQVPLQQLQQQSPIQLSQGGPYAPLLTTSQSDLTRSHFEPVQIPQHDVNSDVKYMPQHASVLEQPVAVSQSQKNFQPQLLLSGFGGDDHVSPTQILDEAAVEYEDDDYYDVQSDEEMPDIEQPQDEDMMVMGRDFSLIQKITRENTNDISIRRYDAFIYEGILTNYQAENVANPLKNPKTARVFAHFIYVTGPSLSIYERNPRNPASLFEGPIPRVQQSLWTYTLPLRALNNQGLLHAMLALSSLHIARLQGASVTPSYKHYAYALKRLSRSLGNPKKRLQTTTLATSMLLAFYEVMTAEHVKWSTHLVGAAQLLYELDFRSLTQEARRLKAEEAAAAEQFPYQNPNMIIDQRELAFRLKETNMMPDENLVSTIVGKQVNYDDFGRVFEEGQSKKNPLPSKLDIPSYEVLQDLYWWYARHDAFQSIISGNPLIMDYRRWSDCPPRAPLNRGDALYGCHDHIVLLLGRIADFTARDRERKLRQVEANGGQWRPTPGMPGMGGLGNMGPPSAQQGQHGQPPTPSSMGPPPHLQGKGPPPGWTGGPPPGWTGGPPPGWSGGPPSGKMGGPPQTSQAGEPSGSRMAPPQSLSSMGPQGQGHPSMPPGQGPLRGGPPPGSAGPGFYGMAPARPPMSLPTSYANPDQVPGNSPKSPQSPNADFSDLPAAYDAAIADWNSMSHAHATIAQILSNTPAFAPLTPDLYPTGPGGNMTPFGPALLHRSYDISTLWAHLHLSQIILLRSHPAMPPAAMMAAGVCAPATQPYATLIGRIAAGMQIPSSKDSPLTPSLGSALIESCMSLFFAGVQYQDAAQREWLVTRLLEIDRRTGWASAGIIARSCETSWERVADLGRGPPYKRRTRPFGEDGPIVMDADGSGAEGGWGGAGIIKPGGKKHEWKGDIGRYEGEDRRFVVRYRSGLVPWAMNILATEEDLRVGMERVGLGGEINVAGTDKEKGKILETLERHREGRE